ncbi:MAG: RsmE family RNA methyltransferase [Pseudomonadota bacterium]|nr:RsmE family RNA methyltransferase [Pseudomonadota bacterium]
MANFSYTREISTTTASFGRDEYRHFITVLRKKTGDLIHFLDGQGGKYTGRIVTIDATANSFQAEVESHHHYRPNFPSITLALALPKGKKFTFIIQKAVELGIRKIIPLESRYSVKQLPASRDKERKLIQWQKTALEAIKQCGNPYLPEIKHPIPLTSLNLPSGKNFVKLLFHGPAAEGISTQATALARTREVLMIIGPEGGFSPEETEFLSGHGCRTISLGSTTLRLETATIAAIAIVQYLAQV